MKRPHVFALGTELRIRWLDSATLSGWRDRTTDLSPERIVSIGTLIAQGPVSITIASTIAEDGESFLEPLTIPRGCITEMRKL